MNETEIKQKLDRLADLHSGRDVVALEKQALIDHVFTDEIKQKIAEIDLEYDGKLDAINENISNLEDEIKQVVLQNGGSIKGTFLHAVWQKGRVSWDTKKLEGLMMIVPQLEGARKEGQPSVSLRPVRS